ncbi:hypothetical protein V8E55_002321 [Tylopilus felleus]
MVLWVGECAFTQHFNVAERKLKTFISLNPKIEVAFLITIKERSPFAHPLPNSPAAQALCSHGVQDLASFLPCYSAARLFGPVVIEDHTRIHVTEITWSIWIKGSSPSIDFNDTSPNSFAKGTLYPKVDMDCVEALFLSGMTAIKVKAVEMQRAANLDGDYSALLAWVPKLDFQWDRMVNRLSQALWNSAHARYVDWYSSNGNPKRKGTSWDSCVRKKAKRN